MKASQAGSQSLSISFKRDPSLRELTACGGHLGRLDQPVRRSSSGSTSSVRFPSSGGGEGLTTSVPLMRIGEATSLSAPTLGAESSRACCAPSLPAIPAQHPRLATLGSRGLNRIETTGQFTAEPPESPLKIIGWKSANFDTTSQLSRPRA